VMYGAQSSLTVALGAVLFGTTVGALWGLACGYFGGRFDMASQRVIEFLQSFPDLILAMAIAKELTSLSLPDIGEAFGGRDHTTVLHGYRKINELRNSDPVVSRDFNALMHILRG
ncbi:MAG: helix-turn-helix domain-containing protein, partial [Nitrosomonas sp.]|nr:helix-turn-helix domain-containing protein [Nitrosomonas sp.]